MPIQADRGRGGGYALDKNYQLPPVNFTALFTLSAARSIALGHRRERTCECFVDECACNIPIDAVDAERVELVRERRRRAQILADERHDIIVENGWKKRFDLRENVVHVNSASSP